MITLKDASEDFGHRGCDRIMVDALGLIVSKMEAARSYGVWVPDIIFVRADGMMLGALTKCESVAVKLWDPIGFRRSRDREFRPMSEYNTNRLEGV